MQIYEQKTSKDVDEHLVKLTGMAKQCPTIKTVVVPCSVRNMKGFIIPCDDKSVLPGTDGAGEIVFVNPFLLHYGLDVTDLLANNIDNL